MSDSDEDSESDVDMGKALQRAASAMRGTAPREPSQIEPDANPSITRCRQARLGQGEDASQTEDKQ